MTKIKVVDINELNNFGIYHFLCWNHFGSQILVWTCYFLKFQIWKVQILSNYKMTKIKVVYLHDLYNFDAYQIFILDHLMSQNYFSSFDFNFLPYTLKAIYQHPLSHFTVDKQYLHHYRTIRILPSRIVHASRLLESPAPSSSPLSQARASRPSPLFLPRHRRPSLSLSLSSTAPPLPLPHSGGASPSPPQRRRLRSPSVPPSTSSPQMACRARCSSPTAASAQNPIHTPELGQSNQTLGHPRHASCAWHPWADRVAVGSPDPELGFRRPRRHRHGVGQRVRRRRQRRRRRGGGGGAGRRGWRWRRRGSWWDVHVRDWRHAARVRAVRARSHRRARARLPHHLRQPRLRGSHGLPRRGGPR